MINISLTEFEYFSESKFNNPFSNGAREYRLHIYPDPKYNNDWVAVAIGVNKELNDDIKIIVKKEVMQLRMTNINTYRPFLTRGEVMRLLQMALQEFNERNEIITFTK